MWGLYVVLFSVLATVQSNQHRNLAVFHGRGFTLEFAVRNLG